ncbi:MAG: tetratricopeptide repeat protein [Marinilabiliaceae bacterium]|nr:tetratricopeptide repeat protein [Marinilabiliaceae bacterium]
MRLIFLSLIISVFFLISCQSVKKATRSTAVTSAMVKQVELDDLQKRKFDYLFYEASREKMKGNIEKAAMYLSECLKIDPTSSATMYELANILAANNKMVKAQGLLERAVHISPDNIWYKLMLADLYQKNKMGIQAVDIYEKLVRDNPENEEYIYGLAQLYLQAQEYDKSLKQYDELEKKLGLNEMIILEKEKILLQLGKHKQALSELEKLINKHPEEARYYGYIADYFLYLEDNEKAKEYYKIVLAKDPTNAMANFSLGNVALMSQDTINFVTYYENGISNPQAPFETKIQRILPLLVGKEKSIEKQSYLNGFFLKLIEAHPHEARGYIYYGNYLKAKGENEEAIIALRSALDIENSNELIWQDFLLLHIDIQDFTSLYKYGMQAIEKFPSNAFFYLLTGSSASQIDLDTLAIKILEKGLKYTGENIPLQAQFLANIGDVYYSLDKPDKAFKSYDESLKLDELNIVVLNNFSYYLTLENLDLDKAERMSSKCVEMEPGNSTYLDTYAWVLFKRERYFEAKYIIERAMDNGGENSDVIVEHYGDILYKNGDVDGALIQWNKALEMGNTSELLPLKINQKQFIEERGE